MSKKLSRRARLREASAFPIGMYSALLTAVFVTLLGLALQHDSKVILVRAAISGVMIGSIVSLGVSFVRMADAEYKDRQSKQS